MTVPFLRGHGKVGPCRPPVARSGPRQPQAAPARVNGKVIHGNEKGETPDKPLYRTQARRRIRQNADAIARRWVAGPEPAARSALINFTYDWDLGDVPVLEDKDEALAQELHVTSVPAVFLISPSGKILRRWDSLVPPVVLGPVLELLAGTP